MRVDDSSFDPAQPGVGDSHWTELLDGREAWEPRPGALVVVSPHPDDESLGVGGLIRQWSLAGHEVTVLSVTDGERAYPEWTGLDVVRRRELIDGLRVLAPVHVSIRRVGIPDGDVASHLNRLRHALQTVLDETTTLVAPYEFDGHPDHEATGRVCLEMARAAQVPLARYPIWAWHLRTARMLADLPWGKYPLNADTQRAKARAIDCFASQIRPPSGDPILPANFLQYFSRPYEAFIV
jgi:LmbE family N-acetylglucosaminyl deacetylase